MSIAMVLGTCRHSNFPHMQDDKCREFTTMKEPAMQDGKQELPAIPRLSPNDFPCPRCHVPAKETCINDGTLHGREFHVSRRERADDANLNREICQCGKPLMPREHVMEEDDWNCRNRVPAALHETIATLRAEATKAAEEMARVRAKYQQLRLKYVLTDADLPVEFEPHLEPFDRVAAFVAAYEKLKDGNCEFCFRNVARVKLTDGTLAHECSDGNVAWCEPCGNEAELLRAELARERELVRDLRQVVKEWTEHIVRSGDLSMCGTCCELKAKADALLEPKQLSEPADTPMEKSK